MGLDGVRPPAGGTETGELWAVHVWPTRHCRGKVPGVAEYRGSCRWDRGWDRRRKRRQFAGEREVCHCAALSDLDEEREFGH